METKADKIEKEYQTGQKIVLQINENVASCLLDLQLDLQLANTITISICETGSFLAYYGLTMAKKQHTVLLISQTTAHYMFTAYNAYMATG